MMFMMLLMMMMWKHGTNVFTTVKTSCDRNVSSMGLCPSASASASVVTVLTVDYFNDERACCFCAKPPEKGN